MATPGEMDGQTPAEEAPFSVIVGMLRWGAQCGILLTRVGIVKHHDRMQVVGYATHGPAVVCPQTR